MTSRFLISLFAMGLALTSAAAQAPAAQEQTLTIFAAASLKNAVDDINTAFTNETKIKVTASYAASSALMKQIEQGAPADIFASADIEWMDYGNQRKLVKSDTRVNLLGNRLVLIAPANSKTTSVTINKDTKFSELLGTDGRLVTGDVRAVPVGKYAKAALEKLGLWAQVEPRMAMAENVRAALALVAREEGPLGIVYETDAKVEPKVKIVGAFPEGSHEPIVYPVAATAQGKADAAKYIQFLRSNAAKTIFEKYGFTWLNKPTS
jgi:molybdate transport system substrate-binding protein